MSSRLPSVWSLIVALLMAISPCASANEDGEPSSHSPVSIQLQINSRSELESLTRLISIEDVRGREVRALATPAQLEKLREAGWKWQVQPAASLAAEPGMCGEGWVGDIDRPWNCYPSYQQYEALLHKFAADNPSLCRLIDLGPTTNLATPKAVGPDRLRRTRHRRTRARSPAHLIDARRRNHRLRVDASPDRPSPPGLWRRSRNHGLGGRNRDLDQPPRQSRRHVFRRRRNGSRCDPFLYHRRRGRFGCRPQSQFPGFRRGRSPRRQPVVARDQDDDGTRGESDLCPLCQLSRRCRGR